MNQLGLIVTAALALAAAPPEVVKKELDQLQGRWVASSVEAAGQVLPKEKLEGASLTIQGDKYVYAFGGRTVEGVYADLDPTQTPKTLDAQRTAGPEKGTVLKGIYTLQGDSLRLCLGAEGKDRPKEFSSANGQRLYLFTRVKK